MRATLTAGYLLPTLVGTVLYVLIFMVIYIDQFFVIGMNDCHSERSPYHLVAKFPCKI